jgi:hypothetical protein
MKFKLLPFVGLVAQRLEQGAHNGNPSVEELGVRLRNEPYLSAPELARN